MNPEILYYVCAVIAVFVAGLAKGGFAGVGALAMPIMALGVDPVRGAAILLPILILQDAVGVWVYRRTWDGSILKVMLPGAAVGIGLGYGRNGAMPSCCHRIRRVGSDFCSVSPAALPARSPMPDRRRSRCGFCPNACRATRW